MATTQQTLNFSPKIGASSSPAVSTLKRPAPSSSQLLTVGIDQINLSEPLPSHQVRADLSARPSSELASTREAAKRVKALPVSAANARGALASTSTAPVTSAAAVKAQGKAVEKESKSQLKKPFDGFDKEVKNQKWQGDAKVLKVDEVLEAAEFDDIFGQAAGNQTQPTATNKPGSTVIIKHFTCSQIEAIFGTEWKADALKGFEWTKGGIFAGKSTKLKAVTATISSMEISYSKNTMRAVLKFDVDAEIQHGGWGYSHGGRYDDDGDW